MAGCVVPDACAQDLPWSHRAADVAIERRPENCALGTLLPGVDAVWLNTVNPRYYNYIKSTLDQFVGSDGSFTPAYQAEKPLDNILLGRQFLLLYGVTQDPRYAKAATLLYRRLFQQPRNASDGFRQEQQCPDQMGLGGLYMTAPFYAEYASTFQHPEAFSDITRQFVLMDASARDLKTGLLRDGGSESTQERRSDRQTDLSSQFWARDMGWHMMALVDTLPYYPAEDPGRKQLIAFLVRDAAAVARYQNRASGLWYQALDNTGDKANHLESSAACMFVYALAKGVRQGYLPPRYLAIAQRGYQGILSHLIQAGTGNAFSLTETADGAGVAANSYRNESYADHLSEKTDIDDSKGVGAFLLASTEIENAEDAKLGRGQTVLLDAWFNSQKHPDALGHQVYFHYKWNDQSNNGYSLLGHIFNNFGAETKTLYTAPTIATLRQAQVYLIVSPDIPVKNPNPHYMQPEDADQIAQWVKDGGVLMIMENDPANADLEHLNLLAERFGIHFNNVLRNQVEGDKFEMGKIAVEGEGPIFRVPHTLFMKEICTITAQSPATALLRDRGDTLMATAKYGKGTVFATVDPWLYNEYTDGRKLPASYDNFAAGNELVRWVLALHPMDNLNK
jgi:unsaturated rhamnogalacturonyl hydrolase